MNFFERFYAFGIFLFRFGITLTSFRDRKAEKWIEGRRHLWASVRKNLNPRRKKFWIHCASLGEFEQGRPLIDRLKEVYPDTQIVLTFFSPSGYEVRYNYKNADHVFYLPIDTKANARELIHYINPRLAIFVKYEFWYFYYKHLYENNVPLIQLSSVFRADQPVFRWYGKPLQRTLKYVDHFFVQDQTSADLLDDHGFFNHSIISDTRYDRVSQMVQKTMRLPSVESFIKGQDVLIGGSTYNKEEELIAGLLEEGYWPGRVIIAPHSVEDHRIEALTERFGDNCCLYSLLQEQQYDDKQVLIIDQIGILGALYRYGSLAFVGGGFRNTLHNTLEPAVYGLPIITGPYYQKFNEAVKLVQRGAAFPVNNYQELVSLFQKQLSDPAKRKEAGALSKKLIDENKGGTEKALKYIRKLLPSKKPADSQKEKKVSQ